MITILASKGKISTRQAMIILALMTLSPEIRLFPQFTAKIAGKAGWLAPVVAIVPLILLVILTQKMFKTYKEASLSDVFYKILGNTIGRIVVSLYLIWMLVLLALYIRYYAERILSSMLPHTSILFLIISMLIMVFIAARYGLTPIARAIEMFFLLFVVILIFTFVLVIPNVTYRNIMNVSYLDIWPVIKSSHIILSIWGYYIFIFFLGDKINDKENIKKIGLKGLMFKFVFCILLLITTIGTLSATLASHISLPFFMMVKNISIWGTIERLESILLSVWIVSDFVIITMFTCISIAIIKSIFVLSDTKALVGPVVLLGGVGALFLFNNRYDLESFSKFIAIPTNIVFAFIIPIFTFIVGKIRKKILK